MNEAAESEKEKIDEKAQTDVDVSMADNNEPIENSPNDAQTSEILKLDVDCFEELFEFLSVNDLHALRQTCTRSKRVVDYFIRTNYPTIQFGYGEVFLNKYICKQYCQLDSSSTKMIKQLKILSEENLNAKDLEILQEILPQFERIEIEIGWLEGDFYEVILKWCTSLKDLSIRNIFGCEVIGDGNKWLSRQYPLIEHIDLNDHEIGSYGEAYEIPELKKFFELNSNIRAFSTNFHFLVMNRHCWLNTSITIDQLNIEGDCFYDKHMIGICGLLNTLYIQGFYKRIHMRAIYIKTQEAMDAIISVRGMEKLHLAQVGIKTTLPSMPKLRELGIGFYGDNDFEDLETVAKNLVNVERINFIRIKSDTIIPILRHAPRVKDIKVDHLDEGTHFKNDVINLFALNEERKTLARACKVTIYVDEKCFLSTKWATSNIDLSLVTLKRNEAFGLKRFVQTDE